MEQQQGTGPESGPGRRGPGFRGAESELLPEKGTWNPESSAALQVQICAGTQLNRQPVHLQAHGKTEQYEILFLFFFK